MLSRALYRNVASRQAITAFTRSATVVSLSSSSPSEKTKPLLHQHPMLHYITQQPISTTATVVQAAALNTTPIISNCTPQTHQPSIPLLNGAAELDEFMAVFPDVVKSVTDTVQRYEQPATTLATTWLKQAMLYNVPKGKRNRGLLVVSTFKLLLAQQQHNSMDETKARHDVRRAQYLGWCVEMLQALFLIADDIMDHSETRRGAPCWYKVPAVGMTAVNDTIMIENLIYTLLRRHFATDEYYTALLELFHEAMLITCIGESLDLQTAAQEIGDFSAQQYTAIVHNKTSFYSFYLPVAVAMQMAGHRDPAHFEQVRRILYEIGHFFQVQDDFLDCFGDVAVTGKIGTDIQDKKCTWLAVKCLEHATAEQRSVMEQCYGSVESRDVAKVRALYEEIGVPEMYAAYEEQSYGEIGEQIANLPDTVPR